MAKTRVIYIGWIGGRLDEQKELEAIGVSAGSHNKEAQCFDHCEVPEESMERLKKVWGKKYIWGLRRTVRVVYDNLKGTEDEDIPF